MEKLFIITGLLLIVLAGIVVVSHEMLNNNINVQQYSTSSSVEQSNTQATDVVTVSTPAQQLSGEGIYLLNGSNSTIYIVFSQPITKVIIFNATFVRTGPISVFNGALELQNSTLYSQLSNLNKVTIQIYNGTAWETVTLQIYSTSHEIQTYGFLVPEGQIYAF